MYECMNNEFISKEGTLSDWAYRLMSIICKGRNWPKWHLAPNRDTMLAIIHLGTHPINNSKRLMQLHGMITKPHNALYGVLAVGHIFYGMRCLK